MLKAALIAPFWAWNMAASMSQMTGFGRCSAQLPESFSGAPHPRHIRDLTCSSAQRPLTWSPEGSALMC